MSDAGAPRGRLLVVDDEDTQREMLASILTRAGFKVETAADGREALERLDSEAFDLLLTDQKMPGMDGLTLLQRAREMRAALPVVLMTAHGSVSSAVAAMKHGAADYLTKPFEKEELIVVLEKTLRQSRRMTTTRWPMGYSKFALPIRILTRRNLFPAPGLRSRLLSAPMPPATPPP